MIRRLLTSHRAALMSSTTGLLSWDELRDIGGGWKGGKGGGDRVNGPTNSQATMRLFGKDEKDVSVTLYRDNHAWCPYCSKVWLWLEEKKIPYKIKKVTMFCYGEKEQWYKDKVPSGMLPAIQLRGKIITESDDILIALEREFGPLRLGMHDPKVIECRQLERKLFRAWCMWLCYPETEMPSVDKRGKEIFESVAKQIENKMDETKGPYFLGEFSTADCILAPYIERMNASLFYYKGYSLRNKEVWPAISDWFNAMEERSTYLGIQSDFHTHVHDLPPQMGGCYSNHTKQAKINQKLVDSGPYHSLPDTNLTPAPKDAHLEAIARVVKHKDAIIKVNPVDESTVNTALLATLTLLAKGEMKKKVKLGKDSDVALRYIRDRINVPRDMSIFAARKLRGALEATAKTCGEREGPSISLTHRRDQNPIPFRKFESC